jgi:transcriptional repressor NrdR
VRAIGSAELTTHDVGLAILGLLQELDLVACLRFASVCRAFDSLEDFGGVSAYAPTSASIGSAACSESPARATAGIWPPRRPAPSARCSVPGGCGRVSQVSAEGS